MKLKNTFLIPALVLFLGSCVTTQEKAEDKSESSVEMAETPAEPEINADSLVSAIDARREAIEAAIGEPLEVQTTDLREKIKQKWSKMDFYTLDGELARIKTYPYPQISTRTEEFYADGGELILVVIEDDGTGEEEKEKGQFDKLYYFHNGEVIKEAHLNDETEYSIQVSDGEELMTEFKEYVTIYESSAK
jgi:hypothetical protein